MVDTMHEHQGLVEQFEAHRPHLRAVAYRMLGSLSEADDAVQEAWLRLSRCNTSGVENLSGWLTRVVGRVCLDMLRARKARREEPLGGHMPLPIVRLVSREEGSDPEHEVLLADSVGLALLVVLETLGPAERLAFVLHDMFGVPFEEIGSLVGRSPAAARQRASRARRRVHGAATVPDVDLDRQREVVAAFLAAACGGDFAALLGVLDPDVVGHAARPMGSAWGTGSGAGGADLRTVCPVRATGAGERSGGSGRGDGWTPAGGAGLHGSGGKVVAIDVIADPTHLRQIDLEVLDG